MRHGSLPASIIKEAAMEPIASFIANLKLARKQVHRNLTLFPLLAPEGNVPDYLILDQALEREAIRITEVDREGSVPDLKLVNRGNTDILILEGEELVGAKQNRVVNATFLIAGGAEVILPVSCVEQGRWHQDSEHFQSGGKVMPSAMRRNHQQDLMCKLESGEGYRSDQGRIWDDIADQSRRLRVDSKTSAMADIYERYDADLDGYVQGFSRAECQAGAVFAIAGKVVGLEAFGFRDTFDRFFGKLVKSYALDAIDAQADEKCGSAAPRDARRFLTSAAKGRSESHSSIGRGETVTTASRSVIGAALVENGRVLHLSAFKKGSGDKDRLTGYQRYSQRRQRRWR